MQSWASIAFVIALFLDPATPFSVDRINPMQHPFCELPGDPSLILTTNIDLGSNKLNIMKGKRNYFRRVKLTEGNHSTFQSHRQTHWKTGNLRRYVNDYLEPNPCSSMYILSSISLAVSIHDKADVIFGGSDEPTALGCLYSIGSIAMESNGAITAAVTEELGVPPARIYINFFDMPRANVGWNGKTFAG